MYQQFGSKRNIGLINKKFGYDPFNRCNFQVRQMIVRSAKMPKRFFHN